MTRKTGRDTSARAPRGMDDSRLTTLGTAPHKPVSVLAGGERAVWNTGRALRRAVDTTEGDPTRPVGAGVAVDPTGHTTAPDHPSALAEVTGHHLTAHQRWFGAPDRLAGRRAALTRQGSHALFAVGGDRSAASGCRTRRGPAEVGVVGSDVVPAVGTSSPPLPNGGPGTRR
ncbi:hypothetical protein OG440_08850 [Streptomyces sp. NBC_00637]|uniref:hypothetical protein n=1 Tax=Streptomyces sp. NBC_00637 TaxID=2903667 RepID=UPI0032557C1C